ncbi:MAG TPA: 3-isopropylmalate dehydratase small subunit [Gemmatimonadaceae bacterium]|nr:3-isopropylmalate dehydratase small subunit [Gemmatimonadaceae bacterium]
MTAHAEAFRARAVLLAADDVDTDQIIPARFLTTTVKTGLGAALFADWRYDADGNPRADFPLNRPEAAGARVLVAGVNFGCGSSREHAPWALLDYGFRAVVSAGFADIFRANALKNGLLPIALGRDDHETLLAHLASADDAAAELHVDLAAQRVTLPNGTALAFPIDPFAKHCLLHGVDEMGYLLDAQAAITAYEAGIRAPRVEVARAG